MLLFRTHNLLQRSHQSGFSILKLITKFTATSISKIILMQDKKSEKILDLGPFYHGTKADLKIGDLLSAGFNSNYKIVN